jgi:3-deoxy-D-manno-octulosonic-acid transferase
VKVFHLPLDFWGLMERAFNRLAPSLLIITETELWPELLATAAKKHVPVFLANGTLSQKSAKRYRVVKKIFWPGFSAFQKLLVQTGQDKTSFANLGIPAEKIEVVGQTKYDLLWNGEDIRPPAELERFFYWAAGSTRPAEEEKILAAHRLLAEKYPNLKLLLAPRHLNRLEEIEGIIRSAGFDSKRASQNPDCQTPVILLDQMGTLLPAYAGAQAAFVGGTLVSVGGHNLLEPPSVGTPVVFGPSVENVQEAALRLAQTNIASAVSSPEELAQAVAHFLELKLPRPEVKRKAQAAFAPLGGVSQKTAELVKIAAGPLTA